MQATSFHMLPNPLRSSERQILPQPKPLKPPAPRVISITTADGCAPTVSIPEKDDRVAAYWDYQFLFMSQRSETKKPIKLEVINGEIPSDFPWGTYYLAGPGLFSDDHGSTVHPLDGHGYLRAFSFNGDPDSNGVTVTYTAKYVRTEAQVEEYDPESNTWRFTHRGPFSVLKGGKKIGNTKVMKNVANTCVIKWGKRLLCLWEGGDPYEIESGTLDTIGKLQVIEGCDSSPISRTMNIIDYMVDVAASFIKPILYGVFKMPPKRMLSHYKIDACRNRLLTVSCNAEDMLLPRNNFTFYEFDSNFKILQRQEYKIPEQLMIHDWAFTDTHYILFGNRIKLDLLGSVGAMSGLSPMISALSVNPSRTTSPIYLLPRFPNINKEERDWRLPIEAPSQLWLLHVANAFQTKREKGVTTIELDASACSYEWFRFQNLFGYSWQSGKLDPSIMNGKDGAQNNNGLLPHLIQVSIILGAKGDSEKCYVKDFSSWKKPSDFPIINPKCSGTKTRFMYAATSSGYRQTLPHFPFDSVVKLDTVRNTTSLWFAGCRRFIGEPIFVDKGQGEDDGYILVVEYAVSIQRCYLVILDAQKIGESDALVARVAVPKCLNFPLGFHGYWDHKN